LACYSEGRRIRKTFSNLDTAIREARAAAAQIQNGLARTSDLSVADRDTFRAAQAMLREHRVPLLSAVEEYTRCRTLLGEAPLLPAVEFPCIDIARALELVPQSVKKVRWF